MLLLESSTLIYEIKLTLEGRNIINDVNFQLNETIYNCVQIYAIVYNLCSTRKRRRWIQVQDSYQKTNCVQIYTIVYSYLQLYTTVYNFIQLDTIICNLILLDTI